jgi:uncharacterized membrane protein YkgB
MNEEKRRENIALELFNTTRLLGLICILIAAILVINVSEKAGLIGLIVSFVIAAIFLWFFCKKAYREYHKNKRRLR